MSLIISTLYREPPREPTVNISGGVAEVTQRLVNIYLNTRDYIVGLNNVTEMKLWGDIDPNYQPEHYAALEADAKWITYEPMFAMVLSAGNGTKTIYVKMRNASNVETVQLTATVTLHCDPHPTVLWTDGRQLPAITGSFQFGWSCSHVWDTMIVALAPSDSATFDQCQPIIETIGPGAAGEHRVTTVSMPTVATNDLAPTQSGAKMMRIFIRSGGSWYS